MSEELHRFLSELGRPAVAVVGDMMLDTYVWGGVSRISPEGPIPVLRVERREQRPGGAGSVAAMLSSLGAEVHAVGMIGQDQAGDALTHALAAAGISTSGLIRRPARPTATKTRFLGYVQSAGRALQQLLRVDEEDTDPVGEKDAKAVLDAVCERLERVELLVVQDMGKGLLGGALTRDLIREAAARGKPVIVDPERTDDYAPYRGATCVLPNRFEAELATGLALRDEEDCREAAGRLLEALDVRGVVIKLDRDGIFFATAAGERKHIATRAREVADVTGAGDMVTAAFALALAAGADYTTAANLANFAAGIEVGLAGAAPVPRRRLTDELRVEADPVSRKLKDRAEAAELAERLRAEGKKVAFTNGCFDLLHLGHVGLIRYARAQGDVLIVGLNTDRSARRIKGPGRPVNSETVRSHVLASLADVDYVVLFDQESVLPLIKEIRPDVLVKGGDYPKEGVVGHEFVESYGGQVRLAPQVEGFSTTELIRKIAGENEGTG